MQNKQIQQLLRNPRIHFGSTVLVLLILAAIFGPYISPFAADDVDLSMRLSPPSWQHPLGCDLHGRDVLSALLVGARVSLYIALLSVLLSTCLGITAGLLSGYFKGFIDMFLMRTVDILMAFPGILLAMSLSSLMGPNLHNLIICISATGWTSTARIVRGQVLSISQREYILASKAIGASTPRTLIYHVLPALMTPLLVSVTFSISGVILIEASLSFLGFGAGGDVPSWGNLLNQGRSVLSEAWHLSFFPGLTILFVVLAFNFIGDALRDSFDPRNKGAKG